MVRRCTVLLKMKRAEELSMNAGMIKEQDDQVILYLDIRYPVTYQWEEIMTVIEEEFAPYGVETRLIHRQDPVYMDKNGPVMGRLLEAYRSVTGDLSEPLCHRRRNLRPFHGQYHCLWP